MMLRIGRETNILRERGRVFREDCIRKERENIGSSGGREDRLSYKHFSKMALFTNSSF